MGKLSDLRDMKQPAAPVVGNTSTKQGPHANGKTTSPAAAQPKRSTPNGSLKAKPKPAGGTTRTEAPMTNAQKLYPSAKR